MPVSGGLAAPCFREDAGELIQIRSQYCAMGMKVWCWQQRAHSPCGEGGRVSCFNRL
jgi:hypothetical protein